MTQPLGGCPGCGGEESFEQVHPGGHADAQCADVSGECPEWLCPACGAGVLIGPVFSDPVFTSPLFSGTVTLGTSAAGAAPAPARQSVRAA
jgi:hypothetical protein